MMALPKPVSVPSMPDAFAGDQDASGGLIWLASRSPRRRQLLESAGYRVHVAPKLLDDGGLRPGSVTPEFWVQALAFLKARYAREHLTSSVPGGSAAVILGADTLCLVDDEVLGQPSDRDAAEGMIRRLSGRSHRTMTGVCLLYRDVRVLLSDVAVVTMGEIGQEAISAYLDGDGWVGKAGGYNLTERQQAGWPILCDGEESTVVGLPMHRVCPLIERLRSDGTGRG